jgi:hypothetical protein
MPFTLAHPAAILPFLKSSRIDGWQSGLFWGCCAPDLIAVPLVMARTLSHSKLGLVDIDIPLGLILAYLWCTVGRDRLGRIPGLNFRRSGLFSFRAALLGSAFGATSHLFWDKFTHEHIPRWIPCSFCSEKLFDTPAGPFRFEQLSWYVSSALGCTVVSVWLYLAARRTPGWPKIFRSRVWLRLAILPLAPILYYVLSTPIGMENPLRDLVLQTLLYPHRIRGMIALSALLGFALLVWETRTRRHAPSPEPSTRPG